MRKFFFVSSLAALLLTLCCFFCGVSPSFAQRSEIFGCCLTGSATALPGQPITGNLNTNWEVALLQDADEMSRLFGVRPHLFYLRESNGANAFSTPSVFPSLLAAEGATVSQYPDGSIFLGMSLLASEARTTKGRMFSLPCVLAHEYAHTLQFRNNFPNAGKWRELHADFLAGYFVAHRSRFAAQNVPDAARTLFEKGDLNFNNPGHHGTPEERYSAFMAGFRFNLASSAPSGSRAYNGGIQYLRSIGARL